MLFCVCVCVYTNKHTLFPHPGKIHKYLLVSRFTYLLYRTNIPTRWVDERVKWMLQITYYRVCALGQQ